MSRALNLLVVEDSEEDVELVASELRRHGLDVACRRVDTSQALRTALESERWDVVLCNFGLPGVDAGEALKITRENGSDVPFVILSGANGEEAAVEALKAGANDLVLKTNVARIGLVVDRELRQAEIRQGERAAEASLRESEERFRQLTENAPDVIFRYRVWPEVTLEYISPAVASISGHMPEELISNPALARGIVHPDDLKLFDSVIKSPQTGPVTIRWVRADGQIRWTETRSAPVYDDDGRLIGISGIARDVSERKRTEEERAKLDAQIAQAERLEALGRLAGGIAHDFNTILSVIGGYADRAGRHAANESQRRELDEIVRATAHAAELTRDLLAFSRTSPRHGSAVVLNDAVVDAQRMLRRLIEANVELVFLPAERLSPVLVDQAQLVRALVNLVLNARDATPPGGRITVETGEVELEETTSLTPAREPGRYVTLRVTDTGRGIDPETRERLFEPFFTTKEAGRGTGLGLATVHAVVDEWGGALEVDSAPGRGSSFTLYFPAAEGVAAQRPSRAPAERPPLIRGDETVLLAEDDASLRTLVSLTLGEAGYRVLLAGDGEEALALATSHTGPIHLLVTDATMPKMSGGALIEELSVLRPDTRVLRITGYSGEDVAATDPEVTVLHKPFGPSELLEHVRETLDRVPASS